MRGKNIKRFCRKFESPLPRAYFPTLFHRTLTTFFEASTAVTRWIPLIFCNFATAMEFIRRWWPTVLTLGLVLWLTLAPDPVPTEDIPLFPGADKLVHAIMMGGLTGAVMFDYERNGLRRTSRLTPGRVWTIVICVGLFCAADEYAQSAMGLGRSTDFLDLLADWTGVAVAALITPPLLRRILRK
jgi:hypothetical protein